MLSFDPTTVYADDWKYNQDYVKDATWERPSDPGYAKVTGLKVRRSSIDTPEMQSLSASFSITSSSAAFVVWQPTAMNPVFEPRPGDRLRIGKAGWVVRKTTANVAGRWTALCEVEK